MDRSDSFECPSCAIEVRGRRRDYETCPYCGYDLPHQKRGHTLMVIVLLLLMVVFVLYLM